MNTISLLMLELILCLITLVFLYKQYKTNGLYIYIIISLILSSLMSLKLTSLFNYDLNLGIIPFVTIFTASNIIIQKNGDIPLLLMLMLVLSKPLIGQIFGLKNKEKM